MGVESRTLSVRVEERSGLIAGHPRYGDNLSRVGHVVTPSSFGRHIIFVARSHGIKWDDVVERGSLRSDPIHVSTYLH